MSRPRRIRKPTLLRYRGWTIPLLVLLTSLQRYDGNHGTMTLVESFTFHPPSAVVVRGPNRRRLVVDASSPRTTRSSLLATVSSESAKTMSRSPDDDDDDEDHVVDEDDDDDGFDTVDDLNVALRRLGRRVERSGEIEHAFRAESLLRRLVDANDDASSSSVRPNTESYNAVVSAWSAAAARLAEGRAVLPTNENGVRHEGGDVYAVRDVLPRAERLLEELETRGLRTDEDDDDRVYPDRRSYAAVTSAHVLGRSDRAVEVAENLLRRMETLSVEREWTWLAPDTEACNRVLEAYARAAGRRRGRRRRRDEDEEEEEEERDVVAAAEELFARMGTPDARSHALLAETHAARAGEGGRTRSARRVGELLRGLEERHRETGDETLRPDAAARTAEMICLVKEARRGDDAAEVATRVEERLSAMEAAYDADRTRRRARPDPRAYAALATARARAGDPAGCERVVDRVEGRGDAPDARVFAAAVDAWVKSRDKDKPRRALRLLKRAVANHEARGAPETRPTTYLHNLVIEACAKCPHGGDVEARTSALNIAFAVLKRARRDPAAPPDDFTYACLFRCVTNLLPRATTARDDHDHDDDQSDDDRDVILRKLWGLAKGAGLVNVSVLRSMRQACDSDFFLELVREDGGDVMVDPRTAYVDYNKLPPEWSKNVRERKK